MLYVTVIIKALKYAITFENNKKCNEMQKQKEKRTYIFFLYSVLVFCGLYMGILISSSFLVPF